MAREIKITTQTHVEEIVVDVQPGLLPEDVEVRAEGHRVFLKSTILFSLLAQVTNAVSVAATRANRTGCASTKQEATLTQPKEHF